MEHHQQRLLHLSPHQEHLMLSPGFFDVVDPLHFHDHGDVFVEPLAAAAGVVDDSAWMEDLMQLGDELFGGGTGDNDVVVDDMVGDEQAWQQEGDGGSPDDQACSYDDVISPDGSGEQGAGCEPSRDDSDLSGTRKRRDRSKTIVSERKRRFRMKEKLYELRALVPNITKMDKASIIADAVEYVKNLQSHARKLKEDVAALEARPGLPGRRQQQQQQQKDRPVAGRRQGQHGRSGNKDDEGSSSRGGGGGGGARVTHVGAVQVGEGRFFVTVECEQRDGGVAAPLCAAVESMDCFRVESSNIGCESDRVVSTLTLKVSEAREDAVINERTVKLWVMAALLNEGFRPEATAEIC
ncbi:transcription factor BHLH156-like [Lolium rigidum]|uniref:transcription factor BHLH156-like n=1 Tax=Lolium rigidum TaxID=89674 RepID=UPI001F5DE314|nr:transcription factor BHLH156-like [Lolium rigidum]